MARLSRRAIVSIAAATGLVALGAGAALAAGALSEPPPRSLGGTVKITDTDPTSAKFTWDENPNRCSGEGEYNDVAPGASITVKDTKGALIGAGRLGNGYPSGFEDLDMGALGMSKAARVCTFSLSVLNVPGRDFYIVQVGQRPAVTVTAADAAHITVQLGS